MLAIAGEDLGATRILRLPERWPTAAALAAASRKEIIEFGRAQRTGYLQRFAGKIQAALAEDQFTAPEHLVRAKVETIRLTARQLLLIDAQRRAREKRMGERGGPAGERVSWRRDQPELSGPRSPSRRQDHRAGRRAHRAVHHAELAAMLCRARPGHPPLRQPRPRRRPPARLQPAPRRRGAQIGLRQPPPLRLGQGLLRRPARGKNHHAALRALGHRWLDYQVWVRR